MFEHLGKHRAILVCGPQRSGTRILARMIAADTGKTYVDEDDYKTDFTIDGLFAEERVIHGPCITRLAHKAPQHAGVVMAARNIDDIQASELRSLPEPMHEAVRRAYGLPEVFWLHPAVLRYEYWRVIQRKILGPRAHEVEYESLSTHPLWVPKERRAGFRWNQWKEGE